MIDGEEIRHTIIFHNRVDAISAVDVVPIRAIGSDEFIIAGFPHQDIVASVASKHVVISSCNKDIVTSIAFEKISDRPAHQQIIFRAANGINLHGK